MLPTGRLRGRKPAAVVTRRDKLFQQKSPVAENPTSAQIWEVKAAQRGGGREFVHYLEALTPDYIGLSISNPFPLDQ